MDKEKEEETVKIDNPLNDTPVVMSKNKLKKLRKLEYALKIKAEKRKKEREQRKLKGRNGKAVIEKPNGQVMDIRRKALKKNLMCNSSNKLRIVIDCSFDHLMSFSDISHLGKQLNYCYAANRRMLNPLQLHLTSFTNKMLLEKLVINNWDIHLSDRHFLEFFQNEPKTQICYLTSDSQNVLEVFDENKIYIIGGLVDHNHHKKLCYEYALKHELSHCQLPINKFMSMKTRQVLTINQVYQIITKYVECNDWKQAFTSTLPLRKGAQTKSDNDNEDQSENEQSEKACEIDTETPNKKAKLEDDESLINKN